MQKISRVKNDQRVLATGLEAYVVDNNKYPLYAKGGEYPNGGNRVHYVYWLIQLTTPVSYLTNVAYIDPFQPKQWGASFFPELGQLPYEYCGYLWRPQFYKEKNGDEGKARNAYCIIGNGPDRWPNFIHLGFTDYVTGQNSPPWTWQDSFIGWKMVYDSTNGTVSSGDIARFGGELPPPPPL